MPTKCKGDKENEKIKIYGDEWYIGRARTESLHLARRMALGTEGVQKREERLPDDLDRDELEFRQQRIDQGLDDDKYYQDRVSEGYLKIVDSWEDTLGHVKKLEAMLKKTNDQRQLDAIYWSITKVYRSLKLVYGD